MVRGGQGASEVARLCGVRKQSAHSWLKSWQAKGAQALKSLPLFCRQVAGKNRKRNTTVPKAKSAYPEEFKREVLAYQASTGQSQKEVAAHFGISPDSLREWQRRAVAPLGALPPVAALEMPETDWCRLSREHRELQMRCEILKKAVGIFSSPSEPATPRSNT
jgi:transposase-like protein